MFGDRESARGRRLVRGTALLGGFIAASVVVTAQMSPPGGGPQDRPFRLRLPASINLEPVTVPEYLNGSSTAIPFTGAVPPPLVPPTIVREARNLWRMTLPPKRGSTAVQVSYELRGVNGVDNQLSLPGWPSSVIQVQLQEILPLPPPNRAGAVVLRGGVRFLMDVNQADRAGSYQGVLTVTVNRL